MAVQKQKTKVKAKLTKAVNLSDETKVVSKTVSISRSDTVRAAISDIDQKVESGHIDLAVLLAEAYSNRFYSDWGYGDFESYAKKELRTHYRKAKYLVDIGEKIVSLGLPTDRIAKIGWTKLKDLVQIMTKDNFEQLFDVVEQNKMTAKDVEIMVRREKVKNGDIEDRPSTTVMKLKMSDAEASVILSAIEQAKLLTANENTVVALEMIATDWLEMKGESPEKTSIQDHIKFLESVYNVEISYSERSDVAFDEMLGSAAPTQSDAVETKPSEVEAEADIDIEFDTIEGPYDDFTDDEDPESLLI